MSREKKQAYVPAAGQMLWRPWDNAIALLLRPQPTNPIDPRAWEILSFTASASEPFTRYLIPTDFIEHFGYQLVQ